LPCRARKEKGGTGGGKAQQGSRRARLFETEEERWRGIEVEADRWDRLVDDCGKKKRRVG
jgi:hypothetical protein